MNRQVIMMSIAAACSAASVLSSILLKAPAGSIAAASLSAIAGVSAVSALLFRSSSAPASEFAARGGDPESAGGVSGSSFAATAESAGAEQSGSSLMLAETSLKLKEAEKLLAVLSNRLLTDSLIFVPLADSIIRAVPSKTEEAAFAVLEKFMVVRNASSDAAEAARKLRVSLEDDSGESSLHRTAERSRLSVREERSVIQNLSRFLRENREHLTAMSAEIEGGLGLLSSITEITERSKLIAFNMSIEAARIGEKGRGFKVIITELHRLNEQTFEFSRKVAEMLGRFREYNELLCNNMEEKAGAVISQADKGMQATESAVESLIASANESVTLTKQVALMSESIDRDLDTVLEALQFQDITRQMIEGASDILSRLRETIDETLSHDPALIDRSRLQNTFSRIRDDLVKNAKTKGEKSALMEVHV
ncbi:methyl-accepting chemotaxis protein [Treponema zuelzerae]|uniref:Methyl-accepting chemotaxis protein n=1 Tax=Teretinema zuelzerae TaxID=156 RepID=A0AAE3EH54_9SPIR|nr:methyl-accepting chemotaxis protein [Teretinema zuelzerae]MCD1653661.1 methyl-accepting chemotaxis protein [Teretinema zuelzerae]